MNRFTRIIGILAAAGGLMWLILGVHPATADPLPPEAAVATGVSPQTPLIADHYAATLLQDGRDVYKQLQYARLAGLNHDLPKLKAALNLCSIELSRMQLPQQVRALDKQLGIIRDNLLQQGKPLDDQLWVPVEAELGHALVFASQPVRNDAMHMLQQGRERVQHNDREGAKTALDKLVKVSEYNLGVFPLSTIRQDLDAAHRAAASQPPLWSASVEALQSALARFHWYTEVPAHELLQAYSDAVGAYALASSPRFRDDQQQAVLDQLIAVKQQLMTLNGNPRLLEHTQQLIDRAHPDSGEIKGLLQELQGAIQHQRQQSVNRYLSNVAGMV